MANFVDNRDPLFAALEAAQEAQEAFDAAIKELTEIEAELTASSDHWSDAQSALIRFMMSHVKGV